MICYRHTLKICVNKYISTATVVTRTRLNVNVCACIASVASKFYIIIIIYCNLVVTRWQWLFYMYTKHEIGYY